MKIERNHILLTIIWLLMLWLTVSQSRELGILEGFVGPDSYLRMVRVGDLHASLDWYNNIIERLAPPQGMDIHWTRPHDILILSLAALVAPFAGWETGIYLAGMMISPLLMLAAALTFYWTTQGLFRPRHWLLPSAALFLLPGVRGAGRLGRPDHHSFFLFLTMVILGLALRTFTSTERDRTAMWLGAAIGFGLWLSVELLFTFVGIAGFLALLWVWSPEERLHQNRDLSLGMLGMVILAVVVETTPAQWLQPAFDKISIVHITIGLLFAGFWWLIGVIQRAEKLPQPISTRLAMGGLAVAIMSAVMELVFPGFFMGPMGQVHPGAVDLLATISEMRSLLRFNSGAFADFLTHFVMSLIAIVYGVHALRQPQDAQKQKGFIGLFCLLIFATMLSVIHIRFSIYMQVMALIFITHLLERMFNHYRSWSFGRMNGVMAGAAAFLVLFGGALGRGLYQSNVEPGDDNKNAERACAAKLVADELRTWSNEPRTVLAFFDYGPELVYRTPHSFVAAPYHRNGQAISDHRAMLRASDDATAIELLNRYQVDAILLCPKPTETDYFDADQPETLYYRITQGEAPDWIGANVLADTSAHNFKLFPLRPDKMGR